MVKSKFTLGMVKKVIERLIRARDDLPLLVYIVVIKIICVGEPSIKIIRFLSKACTWPGLVMLY